METYQPSYDYGPGKETYGKIAQAFDEAYGLPYKGMDRFWRNPTQYREFKQFLYVMAGGWPKLVRQYGRDPDLWDEVPESIPLFGVFTGAQHEFGGNEYLAAACQLAGWSTDDLAFWLLHADAKRRPAVYV